MASNLHLKNSREFNLILRGRGRVEQTHKQAHKTVHKTEIPAWSGWYGFFAPPLFPGVDKMRVLFTTGQCQIVNTHWPLRTLLAIYLSTTWGCAMSSPNVNIEPPPHLLESIRCTNSGFTQRAAFQECLRTTQSLSQDRSPIGNRMT